MFLLLPLLLLVFVAFQPHGTAFASSTAEEEEEEIFTTNGPGVILHKTSGPLDGNTPVKEGFPNNFPAMFIRKAYGIDVVQTRGGKNIMNRMNNDIEKEEKEGKEDVPDADHTSSSSCELDLEVEFGRALLNQARKMFNAQGCEHEFNQFLQTGMSNPDAGWRRMHWVGIEILPNQSLALHSHPNIEFAYIVQGVMHEFRLVDHDSIEKKRVYIPEEIKNEGIGDKTHLKYHGPNLTDLVVKDGTFQHTEYPEGSMFINTIGDVHQSFTKEEGVKLFVMWGDGNADVPNDCYPQNAAFLNEQSAKAWK